MREQMKMMLDEGCKGCVLAMNKTFSAVSTQSLPVRVSTRQCVGP